MVAELQPAENIIWSKGTEQALTLDVEADLVLCGLNLATLIPASFIIILTQRLIVLLDTGWKGFK